MQEHFFQRRKVRVRDVEHVTSFFYNKLSSNNKLLLDDESQLLVMSKNEIVSID